MTSNEDSKQRAINKWVAKLYDFYKGLRLKGEVPTGAEMLAACRGPELSEKAQNAAVTAVRDRVDLELRSVKFVRVSVDATPDNDIQAIGEALRGAKAAASSVSMADRQAALERAKHVRRQATLAAIKSESAARKQAARAKMLADSRARNAAKKVAQARGPVRLR